eukprot:5849263-Prymnesium_polylepis.2
MLHAHSREDLRIVVYLKRVRKVEEDLLSVLRHLAVDDGLLARVHLAAARGRQAGCGGGESGCLSAGSQSRVVATRWWPHGGGRAVVAA